MPSIQYTTKVHSVLKGLRKQHAVGLHKRKQSLIGGSRSKKTKERLTIRRKHSLGAKSSIGEFLQWERSSFSGHGPPPGRCAGKQETVRSWSAIIPRMKKRAERKDSGKSERVQLLTGLGTTQNRHGN